LILLTICILFELCIIEKGSTIMARLYVNSLFIFCALLLVGQMPVAPAFADEALKDTTVHQQIIDKINQSDIPPHVKKQLLNDIRIDMIESVKRANIPEHVKQRLVKDLQQTR